MDDYDSFLNLKEIERKKTYENLLTQLNELKNKCEIMTIDKANLEEENKKLFEINMNSMPAENKLEIDEKINDMTEEFKKQKIFIDNFQKTSAEKDLEKNKIEQHLSNEISRFSLKFHHKILFKFIIK